MKFGSVANPELIDFTLPQDHVTTGEIIKSGSGLSEVCVGCAKWNRQDLKKFYPRGTKDELAYYASQFNSIELNATFYNNYDRSQIEKWTDRVDKGFKFFPKVNNYISHIKRLNEVAEPVLSFTDNIRAFNENLGTIFLQLHDNFGPKNKDRLEAFLTLWPDDLPLAVELRNTSWFNDDTESRWVYDLFEHFKVANIITDTAGRRDLLHMKLTTPTAFIRYVGANHESDYARLDDWIARLKEWVSLGLEQIHFFVHQNLEQASPYLSAYFIEKINTTFSLEVKAPSLAPQQDTLF